MHTRVLVVFVSAVSLAVGQQSFPVSHIDEIVHLKTDFDSREFADLGFARAYPEDGGTLRIEGADDQGLPWKMWFPEVGGLGATRVFRADFDGNGKPDLLFSSMFPRSGRCIEGGTVITLLFESNGRPIPWRIETHGLTNDESEPVTILDLDANGQAELATSECEYAYPGGRGPGEDRWLSGVYEARHARWVPTRPIPVDRYSDAARRRFASFPADLLTWKPVPKEPWPDPLARWESASTVRLAAMLTGEIGCSGPLLDSGACNAADRGARLRDSEGNVYSGWPAVVIDSTGGREIHLADSRVALQRVLVEGVPVRLLGPEIRPWLVWSRGEVPSAPDTLIARLATSSVQSTPIELTEKPEPLPTAVPVKPTPNSSLAALLGLGSGAVVGPKLPRRLAGTRFSRGGKCFLLPLTAADTQPVHPLPCAELGSLESAALQGERTWQRTLFVEGRALAAAERTARLISGVGPGHEVSVRLEPLPDRPGDVVGATQFNRGWLVQWMRGVDSWLVLHSRTGEAISPPIRLDIDGELVDADRSTGFKFLRWEEGVPVEITTVRASIEWVRGG